MTKLFIFTLTLIFSSAAFPIGGDELGNGGDVLVCNNNGVLSYRLLDLAEEASYRGHFQTRAFPEDEALIASTFFGVLKRKDPARACLYSKWYREFKRDSVNVTQPVYDLADEGLVMVPRNCQVRQVVVQYQSPRGGDHSVMRYFVNTSLFIKLNPFNMFALKIHEFIYREGIAMSPARFVNSLGVRSLNALLFSKRLLFIPQAEYSDSLVNIGLPIAEDYCNPNHPIYSK